VALISVSFVQLSLGKGWETRVMRAARKGTATCKINGTRKMAIKTFDLVKLIENARWKVFNLIFSRAN
jgi:hypothetical protein